MIQYKSGATLYHFYRLLPIVGGSAIFCWHTFLHGALAAGLSVLYAEAELPEKAGIQHPTIFFGGISTSLAFLLVFRANLSCEACGSRPLLRRRLTAAILLRCCGAPCRPALLGGCDAGCLAVYQAP
jgi:hypothetical protein